MRAFLILTAAPFLALSACAAPEAGEPVPEPSETMMPVEPDGGIGDGAAPLPDVQAVDAGRIPERYLGVFDYVEGQCLPESDLRMQVEPERIVFYESVGQVQDVALVSNELRVALAMSGEGETWESKLLLSLSDDGQQLIVRGAEGETAEPTDYRKRCE